MNKKIRIRVPATTANLGPGFDTLGMALNLYNLVEVGWRKGGSYNVTNEKGRKLPQGAVKMVRDSAEKFFEVTGFEKMGLEVKITTHIPIARGLGSSVTLRLGVVMGLNEWMGRPLSRDEILTMVSDLEGHPDNAAPAVFGGLVVSGKVQSRVSWLKSPVDSNLKMIAAIPDFEVKTSRARGLLPSSVSFADAVHNLNRSSLLVAAFWDRQYQKAGEFLEDRLHQPYRSRLIPQLFSVLNAAKLAGAVGGWLSGSGSTVMAMGLSDAHEIAAAMKKTFEDTGDSCEVRILKVDNRGAVVLGRG